MNKTKFWLVQIVMIAIISLALGSPVLAHDDDFNDEKWHAKFNAKEVKKTEKHEKKIAKIRTQYDGQKRIDKENKENEKFAKWQKKHERKLAKHNAKHHAGENTENAPPADEPVCVSWFNGVCIAFAN